MLSRLELSLRRFARAYVLNWNTIRYRVEWRRVEEAIQRFGPFQTILDGGCGSGEMLRKVLVNGYAINGIGIEPEPTTFPRLQANLGSWPGIRLLSAHLEEIPLPDQCVDAILTTQVLEHIERHEKVAQEFSRLLQPGGILLVGVPHPPEPFPNDGHVREGYTEADLIDLFTPFGFQHLETEYYLTRKTINRTIWARRFFFGGRLFPVAWADCERNLTKEERFGGIPFGILGVFRKS